MAARLPNRTEDECDLAGLHPRSVTALMNLDYDHVAAKAHKVRWNIKAWAKKSFGEQRETLIDNGVYVFDANGVSAKEEQHAENKEGDVTADDSDWSHADWGGSQSADSTDVSDNEAFEPPVAKRRRMKSDRNTGGHLQNHSLRGCIPKQCDACRLSREIGTIFELAFGTSAFIPAELTRFGDTPNTKKLKRFASNGCELPAKLYLLTVRENGIAYYGPKPLWYSPSARWLAGVPGMSFEILLARILLFLSPSQKFLPVGMDIQVRWVPVELNKAGVDPMDGISRISFDLFKLLFGQGAISNGFYAARQFRGLFWNSEMMEVGLAK